MIAGVCPLVRRHPFGLMFVHLITRIIIGYDSPSEDPISTMTFAQSRTPFVTLSYHYQISRPLWSTEVLCS